MISQEQYGAVFVTTLPADVQVIDPDTLDFSSPLGALAFRFKHGWILVNPLIPSRGSSGGGLARQHGHLSGGFTVGRFHKGSDGKAIFKAEKRYASQADWEKEIRKAAEDVHAKHIEVQSAVKDAEGATAKADRLAGDGGSLAAQAKAHADAAKAHLVAAEAYKAAGTGPAHQSGAMVHTAHAALHESSASKLAEEATQRAKAKAELKKAAALDATNKANELSKTAKHAPAGMSLKEQAAGHEKAALAHGAAQKINEAAGNQYVAKAHGAAGVFHEKAAQGLHDQQGAREQEAARLSHQAEQASGAANYASAGSPAAEKIAAHQKAAELHGLAAQAHVKAGSPGIAEEHTAAQGVHSGKIAELEKQKAAEEAAQARARELTAKAKAASAGADSAGHGEAGLRAHQQAAIAHLKAKDAAQKAGLPQDAQSAHDAAMAHLSKAEAMTAPIMAAKAKIAEAEHKAYEATKAAGEAGNTQQAVPHHLGASSAYASAQEAAASIGDTAAAQSYGEKADDAYSKAEAIAEHIAAAKADYTKAATAAHGATSETGKNHPLSEAVAAHLQAADAHATAAEAASKAGYLTSAVQHKNMAQTHLSKAKEISSANDSAGQELNKGSDAEDLGNHDLAVQHYQKAAEYAVKAGNHHLEAKALHLKAGLTHTAEDHKAAGLAASQAVPHAAPGLKEKYQAQAAHHEAAAKEAAKQAAGPQPGEKAEAPQAGKTPLKPVGHLTGTGTVVGSHGSEVMHDEAGNKWLKKTDSHGYTRTLDPAVAALHRKVGLETPVFVKTKEGHLQGMIPGAKEAFPNGKFDPEKLSPQDVTSMLQHQVLDYATGNQDTHSGQWLKTPDGKLTQIDQSQSFKFGVGKGNGGYGTGDPTTTYTPNSPDVPVYPKLWNAAQAGKVQIPDPKGDNEFAKTIKTIQDMPDDQFKALFKPYAEQVIKNGGHPGGHTTVDGFLNDIAAHKNKLGDNFQKLYDSLPPATKNSPSAPSALSPKEDALHQVALYAHDPDAWKGPSYGDLKAKAKAEGASFGEIMDILDDPEKFLDTMKAKTGVPAAPAPSAAPASTAATSTASTAKKGAAALPSPKAKWSKTTQSVPVHHSDGTAGTQMVEALSGPGGLHVHKAIGGKGWTVSSYDGKKVISDHLSTQKEAKLAAEWMAKNHAKTLITEASHKKWLEEHPDQVQKFKEELAKKPWLPNAAPAAPAAPPALKTFTGLGSDKAANAKLMKELYDQAHGPHASPEAVAEYEKAQQAWQDKHSTGPFDPSKFTDKTSPAPGSTGSPSSPEALYAKTKKHFPKAAEAGYLLPATNQSLTPGWTPTPEQKKGPLLYSGSAYSSINNQLRHGTGPKGGSYDDTIASCDKAFAAVPPLDKDIVLGRQMSGNGPFDSFPPPMTPGAVYQDKGYSSTTKTPGVWSGDLSMEIRVPKGTRVLDLNHTSGSYHTSEQEVMLNRGTKYRVISDTKVGHTRHVVVEVINSGEM